MESKLRFWVQVAALPRQPNHHAGRVTNSAPRHPCSATLGTDLNADNSGLSDVPSRRIENDRFINICGDCLKFCGISLSYNASDGDIGPVALDFSSLCRGDGRDKTIAAAKNLFITKPSSCKANDHWYRLPHELSTATPQPFPKYGKLLNSN